MVRPRSCPKSDKLARGAQARRTPPSRERSKLQPIRSHVGKPCSAKWDAMSMRSFSTNSTWLCDVRLFPESRHRAGILQVHALVGAVFAVGAGAGRQAARRVEDAAAGHIDIAKTSAIWAAGRRIAIIVAARSPATDLRLAALGRSPNLFRAARRSRRRRGRGSRRRF